jgi:hypothetical protein
MRFSLLFQISAAASFCSCIAVCKTTQTLFRLLWFWKAKKEVEIWFERIEGPVVGLMP